LQNGARAPDRGRVSTRLHDLRDRIRRLDAHGLGGIAQCRDERIEEVRPLKPARRSQRNDTCFRVRRSERTQQDLEVGARSRPSILGTV
jgi:hypothetical protein